MEATLKAAGAVAGLGGLCVALVLIVFRDILAQKIFPQLRKNDAYKIIRLLILATSTIAVIGMILWVAPTIVVGNNNIVGGLR